MKIKSAVAHIALAATLACGAASQANATIIAQNDAKFGANSLTFDSATKLQWLDLTLSTNRSYSNVLGQLGAGGAYAGFRFATALELMTLETNFGFDLINSYNTTTGNGIPAYNFLALLGNTRPETNGGFNPFTDGFVQGAEVMVVGGVCYDGVCDGSAGDQGHAFSRGVYGASYASSDTGSFLVRRAAEVPEPASLALFGVALAAMARVRKSRKQA